MFTCVEISFSVHTGGELLQADSPAGDAVLKQLWHHSDAIMCCSVKMNVSHFSSLHFFSLCFSLFFIRKTDYFTKWCLTAGISSFHVCKPGRPRHAGDDPSRPSGHNAREDSRRSWPENSPVGVLQDHAAGKKSTNYQLVFLGKISVSS